MTDDGVLSTAGMRCYGALDFLREIPFDDVEGDLHDYLDSELFARIDDLKDLSELGKQVSGWNRPEREDEVSSWQKTAVRSFDHDADSSLGSLSSILLNEIEEGSFGSVMKSLLISAAIKVRYGLSTVRFMLNDDVDSLDQITLERQRDIISRDYDKITMENSTTKKPIYLSVLAYGCVDNLLRNAQRFVNDDANITYKEVYDVERRELRLEVSDKGSGIMIREKEGLETEIEKHIPRLLEKDYSTRDNDGGGKPTPGLGLHLVYLASKTYGGYVKVETSSEEGKFTYSTENEVPGGERNKVQVLTRVPQEQTGTTFTLVIPMEELEDRLVPTYGEVNRETLVDD